MNRRLSELNPIFYKLAVNRNIYIRKWTWLKKAKSYTSERSDVSLPICVYKHKSLIRRKLGNVDLDLQENKAKNLELATPFIDKIIINPGEIFSFWFHVGKATKRRGFKEGLIIKNGAVSQGIGGGMCQFTNLIHWMILHSPLDICEHHHHNQIDLFPDYGRQVPFGTGTSIMYNYLDYQFMNNTKQQFQLITYITDEYLCGELRCEHELDISYHISEENCFFSKENSKYYRNNEIYRMTNNKKTGNIIKRECIIKNKSKVMYDKKFIDPEKLK